MCIAIQYHMQFSYASLTICEGRDAPAMQRNPHIKNNILLESAMGLVILANSKPIIYVSHLNK